MAVRPTEEAFYNLSEIESVQEMELSKQEIELFLLLLDLGSIKFILKMFPI